MTNTTQPARAKGRWKPVLTVLLLTPVSGELLTSSAPPFVFFIPWVFALFLMLYGCGALLIRELAVRWKCGWTGILLMGAAYGILEEGLGAKSFFDPHWRAIGPLGEHGRWLGVNWVWTIGLIVFHSLFCIGLSILGASLPYPEHRNRPWLGRFGLITTAVIYFLVLHLFFTKGNENGYRAAPVYYWASVAAAAALVLAARFWRPGGEPSGEYSEGSAKILALTGFVATTLFVFLIYFFPGTGAPAWVTGALMSGMAAAVSLLLWRYTDGGRRPLSPWQEFCLMAGAFGSFAIQAPLQEINPSRGAAAMGMSAVGIACAFYLWWLGSRARLAKPSSAQFTGALYGH